MNFQNYTNILIIKPSALGDIVHTLPVLGSLRTSFPGARLTWLVRKEFAPLLECTPELDEVIIFDRKQMSKWHSRQFFSLLKDLKNDLRQRQFDLVLDFQGLFRSGVFSWMTGCPQRIGMKEAREFANFFHTDVVNRPLGTVHLLDYYLEVLRYIGTSEIKTRYHLSAPEEARHSVLEKMQAYGLAAGKFAVLVPGSAHAYKCWPARRFAELANQLHSQYGYAVAAVGTAGERPAVQKIQEHADVIDLTGQTSIPELVALFEQAGCVVSNDTGPGHIALATPTPTVIVFGNTNPLRLGPYQRPECIAAVDLENRKAEIKDKNPAHHIEKVTVEMVLDKTAAQLKK